MKKVILFVALINNFFFNAQESLIYRFDNYSIVAECSLHGQLVKKNNQKIIYDAKPGYLFTKVLEETDSIIIHFLNWNTDSLNFQKFNEVKSCVGCEKYFKIPSSVFKNECSIEEPRKSFIFGLTTLPLKMRFGDNDNKKSFDYEASTSLGLVFGLQIKPYSNRKFTFSLVGGLNLTSIKLDSLTSRGFVNSESKFAAVTPTCGVMLNFDEFTIAVYSGVDMIGGKAGTNWIYRDRPWFGVGLGYKVFDKGKVEKNQ